MKRQATSGTGCPPEHAPPGFTGPEALSAPSLSIWKRYLQQQNEQISPDAGQLETALDGVEVKASGDAAWADVGACSRSVDACCPS